MLETPKPPHNLPQPFFAFGIRQWQWSRQGLFSIQIWSCGRVPHWSFQSIARDAPALRRKDGLHRCFPVSKLRISIGNTTKQSRILHWILDVARWMLNKIVEYELVFCAVKGILYDFTHMLISNKLDRHLLVSSLSISTSKLYHISSQWVPWVQIGIKYQCTGPSSQSSAEHSVEKLWPAWMNQHLGQYVDINSLADHSPKDRDLVALESLEVSSLENSRDEIAPMSQNCSGVAVGYISLPSLRSWYLQRWTSGCCRLLTWSLPCLTEALGFMSLYC